MRISVFGLGYVGAVTAGCLAELGHHIVGVDVQSQKVDDFNRGQAPIIEPELDTLLRQAHTKGLLRATTNTADAISETDVSLICVGTPSRSNSAPDISNVQDVAREIAEALKQRPKRHAVVFRSTMLPGSTRQLAAGETYYHPEFLREGTAVADFREPSLTVVGTQDGKPFSPEMKPLFGRNAAVVNWETAEMIKYASNAFHATKVAFANEIGRVAKQNQIDAQAVMDLLCRDTRLNVSSYYLRPGNPFGGSCLPKDVRALAHFARQQGMSLPLVENLLTSNQQHLQHLLNIIAESGQEEVVILGLSFKLNTDDLRESAMVEVAQNVLGHRYPLRIYDPQLNLARLMGSNRRVIDLKMPHLASLLKDNLKAALGSAGLVIAAQKCATIGELAPHITPKHHVLDINGWPELRALPCRYEGLCW
ncbi:MAG TPA: nucleotide sugar dehydrogenase [Verrucomicrobiae bacterium]|nr:nucleotide sugar dehydrogenase [Verrucomicrobiae bacterium]